MFFYHDTKYSIKDSQNTFIKVCDTSAEMEALIVKLGQKGATTLHLGNWLSK